MANRSDREPGTTVAMANKTARVIWSIMARGETYHADHRPALAA